MPEHPPSDDTNAWFDALAGRRSRADAHAGDAASVAEGQLLREALRRWPAAEPAADGAADRARLTALLAAAHANDRLAAHRGCAACQALARWLSWRRLTGAIVLAGAVSTVMLGPWRASVTAPTAPEAGEGFRGSGSEGVQRLRAADPRTLRDRIVADLAQAGVTATRYERLGRYGLDAELPAVRSDELRRLLARYGIAVPPSGGLAVEIEAAP